MIFIKMSGIVTRMRRDYRETRMRGLPLRQHLPDLHRRNARIPQSVRQRCSVRRGNQQPTRSLRIKQQRPHIVRHSVVVLHQALGKVPVVLESSGNIPGTHTLQRALDQRHTVRQKC